MILGGNLRVWETLSGGFKILQRIVSGEDFSESLQVEFLGDGFMRRF